jgi:lipopolysaccharide/colanic/teichoic acid biosynthesis glycosyltransferase
VTGLAQVNGRNAIPWSRRNEMDIDYVERWSMGLDLRILGRTLLVVLGRGGTYKGTAGGFDLPERGAEDARA